MSAAAAHMKLAATQIKSSFLPQPFCCSSALPPAAGDAWQRNRTVPAGATAVIQKHLAERAKES